MTEVVWPTTNVNGLIGWVGNIAELLMKTQCQTTDMIGDPTHGQQQLTLFNGFYGQHQ